VSDLTIAEKKEILWRAGDLRYKVRKCQRPLYAFLDPSPVQPGAPLIRVANCSRRFGKSTNGLIRACEVAIKKPGSQVRYAAATGKELRNLALPLMRLILDDCPPDLRPMWNQFDHAWRWPNGSGTHMAGSDNQNADNLRGTWSDLNIIEEAGHVDDLDYLVRDVLLPQTLTTLAPTLLIGTPPRTPAHDFHSFALEAQGRGAYLELTIDENTAVTPDVRAAFVAEAGGEDSSTWKREYLCQFVIDEDVAVVPEFTRERAAAIVQPVSPPTWEQPIIAMDVGFQDAHAILYAYWDFRRAKLCIQAEDILRQATTDVIARAIKEREAKLWTVRRSNVPPSRWSDVDLRLIADLWTGHGLGVSPTAKDDLEAQVNAVRLLVKEEKIQIDPACTTLIRQLRSAIWKDNRREFERTKAEGHFDAVASLIYLVRNVDRVTCPYPAFGDEVTEASHFMYNRRPRNREHLEDLAAAFGRGRA
jgi:hypothetical protein